MNVLQESLPEQIYRITPQGRLDAVTVPALEAAIEHAANLTDDAMHLILIHTVDLQQTPEEIIRRQIGLALGLTSGNIVLLLRAAVASGRFELAESVYNLSNNGNNTFPRQKVASYSGSGVESR